MASGSLRNRILLGYGAVLLLLTVALAWSFASLIRLGQASSAILSENYRSIGAAENMVAALERQDSAVLLAILGAGEAPRAQYREGEVEFRRQLELARGNVTIAAERRVIERIAAAYDRYDAGVEAAIEGAGGPDAGRAAYFERHLPALEAVRHEVVGLRELNQEAMYEASREAEDLADQVVVSAGLLGLGAIGIGLVLSLLLSRHLTRPVERLRAAAGRVAEGDYDVAVDVRRSDELGFLALQFNDMVERLRLYRDLNLERLLTERVKTEAILREMSDGLLIADPEGRFLHANPAAAAALGLSSEGLVGRPVEEVLGDDPLGAALLAANGPEPGRATGLLEREHDGRRRTYQYAMSRIEAGPGAPVGTLAVLRDVTEMRELDRLKSEFVATASHELRTPITTIGMSLALLEERISSALDPRTTRLLEAARGDAARLERLVGDLLDLSKLEAGRLEPELGPVDAIDLLHEIEDSFRAQAADGGIDLETEAGPAALPPARADRELLRRAVSNLVANAIRYTPRGGSVRLAARRVAGGVRIEVRDTGPGIGAGQRERIFERFARADVPGASGGSGLGLALAREIAVAQGGTIDVEPNAGRGSVFLLVLPAAR